MLLELLAPMKYYYVYLAMIVFLVAVFVFSVIIRHRNQIELSKSLARQKEKYSQNRSSAKSRVYVAQADKDLDMDKRRECKEFGSLITVIGGRKTKNISAAVLLLGFNLVMTYLFTDDYKSLTLAEEANAIYLVVFAIIANLITTYFALTILHQSTYSVSLYKKGLAISSMLFCQAYFYDHISDIKTYEQTNKNSRGRFSIGNSFSSKNPPWICEIKFDDNNTVILDSRRYNLTLRDKIQRWEKSLNKG